MTSKSLFVETLEPRVAPAILVNGGNLLGGDGNPLTGETSSGGNTVTLVKVISGSALVFYDGDHSHITSISVGPGTQLELTGDVQDIVTNLGKNGRLTDSNGDPSDGEDGGILLPSTIKGITTNPLGGAEHGSIGRIIAGGSIKNIVTNDGQATVHGIYAGDGVFRNTSELVVSTGAVDPNSIDSQNANAFDLRQDQSNFKAAASIKTVTVSIGAGLEVFAGSGQSSDSANGGIGGSITDVHVIKSFASQGSAAAIFLYAGDGGNGKAGGAGGSISGFTDDGSTTVVKVQTGHGGGGFDGNGGNGGSFLNSTITTKSPAYRFAIGDGGDGSAHGGAGGSIKGLAFTTSIVTSQLFTASGARSSGTLITSGDFNGDGQNDVVVVNSTSGNAIVSVAGGAGGAFTQVTQPDGTDSVAPVGLTPSDIVTGDFNLDGKLDFAVSYADSNNLGVFLNRGDGRFDATQVGLSDSPYRLAAGDFGGTAATDLAYLALPASTTVGAAVTSQVYLVQNDGAGTFSPKLTPTSIAGTASDLVAANINADPLTDIFVSLNDTAGTVQALVASNVGSGVPFNGISSLATGVAHITNLDATVAGGSLRLLAFSSDVSAGGTGGDTVSAAPALHLLRIGPSGQALSNLTGSAVSGSTLAQFVGSQGDYGTLTPTSVQITSYDGGASRSYSTSDGNIKNFTPLGGGIDDPVVAVGAIPTRFFYSAGTSLVANSLPVTPQVFSFVGGNGGHGGALSGGKGGGIKALTLTETLDGGADASGGTYTVTLAAGSGGVSDAAAGGSGGALKKLSINVDPANSIAAIDDTTLLKMQAGAGGVGATIGGKGGSITGLTATALYDESNEAGVRVNSFAVELDAGAGGDGAQGRGGEGGAVTLDGKASLTGVSFYDIDSPNVLDPALLVTGGAGGAGAVSGGAGGSIINVGSQNALLGGGAVLATNELTSALLSAGSGGAGAGGNGGKGGEILTADVSVQARSVINANTGVQFTFGGAVEAFGGDGGVGTGGFGGKGGKVKGSTLASVQGDSFLGVGVLVAGGAGGDGTTGGGAGGAVQKLTLNSPSDPSLYAAALFGGNGGNALESGLGGKGGAIKAISQTKDVNSSINVILAGAGGGGGGVGGSVLNVKTVGFIGSPNSAAGGAESNTQNLGAFNNTVNSPQIASFFPEGVVPQGIFAGRGEGGNGSVTGVTARQIAAIGAAPDATGVFAPAKFVGDVSADLIGFEVNRDGVFQSSDGAGGSPADVPPVDGFILATALGQITGVNATRTAPFTFIG